MPANKKVNIDQEELQILSPDEYEKKYVHNTYNQIADHFSETRYRPWPMVKKFLESLHSDSIMVEVGCGNGKNLSISPGTSIGCDICPELLAIAKEKNKNCEVVLCDALNLTFQNNFADIVISIAVIHHFVTQERRLNAVKEMLRILKPNGIMLIYVWANDEKQNGDCFVGWTKNSNDNTHK
jgi:ubiquinone/menaquinone biosynthesis C-methylase UbiE